MIRVLWRALAYAAAILLLSWVAGLVELALSN